MYWNEEQVAIVSLPLVIWATAFVILYLLARSGRIEIQTNLLALTGAFLGFCSFLVGWDVIQRGSDWSGVGTVCIFLLFTYPFTVITPVAGIGNAAVLLYAISGAIQAGGVIEPMSGYLLGWLSVAVLITSMIAPLGSEYDGNWRFPFGHRYFTLHFTRKVTRPAQHPTQAKGRMVTGMTIAIVTVWLVVILIMAVAVLHSMVVESHPPGPGATPTATYSKTSVTNGYIVTIVLITYPYISWDQIRVQMTDGSNWCELEPTAADLDGGSAVSDALGGDVAVLGRITVNCTVTDDDGNGFVTGGDSFRLLSENWASGVTYTAVLIWMETHERMGNGITFSFQTGS